MRNPSEQEQVLINKRVSSYLIEEVFRLVLTSIVFIVLGVGLMYNHLTTINAFGSLSNILMFVVYAALIFVLGYVVYDCARDVIVNKDILKACAYSVEDCNVCNVSTSMNRSRKEIELVGNYKTLSGDTSDNKYQILTSSNSFTVSEVEGVDSLFVKMSDKLGLIVLK